MNLLGNVQYVVLLVLGVGSLALTGFAFVDALRRPGQLFPHVGKLTKGVWLGILAAAVLIAIVSFGYTRTLGLLNVIGVIAAGVYMADVRPKLKSIGGGGGSQRGPYGPY